MIVPWICPLALKKLKISLPIVTPRAVEFINPLLRGKRYSAKPSAVPRWVTGGE